MSVLHGWSGLGLLAAAGAVVELDKDAVGQFMISQPMVFSPVAGFLFGQTRLGFELGVLYELFTLSELPVGGRLSLNACMAGLTALLLTLGGGAVPVELAFPVGLACGWLSSRAEVAWRSRAADASWAAPDRRFDVFFLGQAARSVSGRLALTASLEAAVLAARWWAGRSGGLELGFFGESLRWAYALAPWIALAGLYRALRLVV